MKQPEFDVSHRWTLRARPEELTDIVLDTTCYERWCARVLMKCDIVEPGHADGLGLTVRLHTKGWLPHSFLFQARISDLIPHQRMTVEVTGDFVGRGDMDIVETDAETVVVAIRWRVDVRHPQVRWFVPLVHRLLVRNHTWAVRSVQRMMQAEIDRRRGSATPEVPAPTFRAYVAALRRRHRRRAARLLGWREFDRQRTAAVSRRPGAGGRT